MPSMPLPQGKPLDVPRAMHQALELHHAGRMAEAEQLYATVLAVRPDHVDALQMLGVIKLSRGEQATALRLISAAMQLRPKSPQILFNLRARSHRPGAPRGCAGELRTALKHKGRFRRGAQQSRRRAGGAGAQRGSAGEFQPRHRDQAGLCRGASTTRATRCTELDRNDEALQELRPRDCAAPELRQGALQPRLGAGRARPHRRCVGQLRPRARDRSPTCRKRCCNRCGALFALKRYRRSAAMPRSAAGGRTRTNAEGALHARPRHGRTQPARRCAGELREGRCARARRSARRAGLVHVRRCRSSTPRKARLRRAAPNMNAGCARCAPITRPAAFRATCPRDWAGRSRFFSPTRAITTATCRPCSAVSPRGSWPRATAKRSLRHRPHRASRCASASSAAFSVSIRSGRSASRAGSRQLDPQAIPDVRLSHRPKQDGETELAAEALPPLRQGPHSLERWREKILADRPHMLHLSGNRDEPPGGRDRGAAAGAGAMQLHRSPADQRLSDHRLLPERRTDRAAGRRRALFGKAGPASQHRLPLRAAGACRRSR